MEDWPVSDLRGLPDLGGLNLSPRWPHYLISHVRATTWDCFYQNGPFISWWSLMALRLKPLLQPGWSLTAIKLRNPAVRF